MGRSSNRGAKVPNPVQSLEPHVIPQAAPGITPKHWAPNHYLKPIPEKRKEKKVNFSSDTNHLQFFSSFFPSKSKLMVNYVIIPAQESAI